MTWLDQPLLVLDTETTGPDPETARIVQITVSYSARPGHWTPWTTLVNPGVPIPAEATAVHGITDEMVVDAPTTADALFAIFERFGPAPLVAHNAAFDLTVLDRECQRHVPDLLDEMPSCVLDTLILHWRFDPRSGSRRLEKLAEREGIIFPAHDSEADSLATLRLLHILAGHNDLLGLIEPGTLHAAQVGWWQQRQDQIVARAEGAGRPFIRQDAWPVIPARGDAA